MALTAVFILMLASTLAWGSAGSADSPVAASAGAGKQLRSLKKRISALEAKGVTPGGPAGGDLTGAYPGPQISPNAIAGPEIAPNAISTPKLADDAVTASKLATGSVTSRAVGQVTFRSATAMVDNGDGTAQANCAPGEQILGAQAGFYDNTDDNVWVAHKLINNFSDSDQDSVVVLGRNGAFADPIPLTATATCLRP